MATKRITPRDEAAYRGPARRKRQLFGLPGGFTPVPISRMAARIQSNTGIVAKLAPSTAKAYKKFDTKVAGAF